MQKNEFERRTGVYLTDLQYRCAEREYERQDENGRDVWPDKDAFCAAYRDNKDGLAERIQHQADEAVWRMEERHRCAMTDSSDRVQELCAKIRTLELALDTEREWTPCEDAGTRLPQAKYEELDKNAVDLDRLSDEHAAEMISEMFGFIPSLIEIRHEADTYERDRHGHLRVRETFERDPICISTDWNYIRFDCAGCQWELIDGALSAYED